MSIVEQLYVDLSDDPRVYIWNVKPCESIFLSEVS